MISMVSNFERFFSRFNGFSGFNGFNHFNCSARLNLLIFRSKLIKSKTKISGSLFTVFLFGQFQRSRRLLFLYWGFHRFRFIAVIKRISSCKDLLLKGFLILAYFLTCFSQFGKRFIKTNLSILWISTFSSIVFKFVPKIKSHRIFSS